MMTTLLEHTNSFASLCCRFFRLLSLQLLVAAIIIVVISLDFFVNELSQTHTPIEYLKFIRLLVPDTMFKFIA